MQKLLRLMVRPVRWLEPEKSPSDNPLLKPGSSLQGVKQTVVAAEVNHAIVYER